MITLFFEHYSRWVLNGYLFLTNPLLLRYETRVSTRWLANLNRGHSHFPRSFWSSHAFGYGLKDLEIFMKSSPMMN